MDLMIGFGLTVIELPGNTSWVDWFGNSDTTLFMFESPETISGVIHDEETLKKFTKIRLNLINIIKVE
jgi:hypothetical protein